MAASDFRISRGVFSFCLGGIKQFREGAGRVISQDLGNCLEYWGSAGTPRHLHPALVCPPVCPRRGNYSLSQRPQGQKQTPGPSRWQHQLPSLGLPTMPWMPLASAEVAGLRYWPLYSPGPKWLSFDLFCTLGCCIQLLRNLWKLLFSPKLVNICYESFLNFDLQL